MLLFSHYISLSILRQIIGINTTKYKHINNSRVGHSVKIIIKKSKKIPFRFTTKKSFYNFNILPLRILGCIRYCLFPSHSNRNRVYSIITQVRQKVCLDLQFIEYLHRTSKIFSLIVFLY